MPNLILLFNHGLTRKQGEDARRSLGVKEFIHLPEDSQKLWKQVPADLGQINDYLKPLMQWLQNTAVPGDFILIQGDFGATHLMVGFARRLNLTPVYATTGREVVEEILPGESVQATHRFRHVIFRRYEE